MRSMKMYMIRIGAFCGMSVMMLEQEGKELFEIR